MCSINPHVKIGRLHYMEQNVVKNTAKGTIWSMIERFSTMGIQLLCTLVIARFLSPDQFGLVSMISIFMAFSMVIIDSGFAQAIIRDQNTSQLDYSSVFYFNILVGGAVYCFAFITAPFIADFYNEPLLTPLVRVTFISMVCLSLSVVQQAKLFKEINFKTVSKISFISALISGICGICVAYHLHSVWALIVQSVSSSVIRVCLLWYYGRWYPSFKYSWSAIRKYLAFSMNLLGTNIIASITDNLPSLLIGKWYSASALAFYSIPEKIQRSLSGTLSFSIHRVTYPIMASFQNDTDKLLAYSNKVVGMAFFVISPLMVILGILAKPFILTILSEEWIVSAEYLQFLSVFGALYCFGDINLDILIVRGKTKQVLIIEIIRKIVFVASIIIGLFISMPGLLALLVGYQFFNAVLVSYYAEKEIEGNLIILFKSILPTILCLIPAAIGGYSITLLNIEPILKFTVGSILIIFIYGLSAKLIRNQYWNFCFSTVKKLTIVR